MISVTREEFDRSVPAEFPGQGWAPTNWVGQEYGDLLMAWLTNKGSWYRAELMSEASWKTLRAKMLAIVNEHRLSLRARHASLPLVGYKQLVLLSRLRSRRSVEAMLAGYDAYPFMGDDRDRSPTFRLFMIAGVWVAALGLDRVAVWAVNRAVAEHRRDRRRAEQGWGVLRRKVEVAGTDSDG